jgi:hypothetical protein
MDGIVLDGSAGHRDPGPHALLGNAGYAPLEPGELLPRVLIQGAQLVL